MIKKSMTAVSSTLGAGSYESPAMNVVEIATEGVICVSGNFEEWDEETLEW